MYNDIREAKICTQKFLLHHQYELNNINRSDLSSQHKQRLRAAFITKKLWPKGSKIRIGFLDTGKQITKTPIEELKANGDSKIDPLQNEVGQMSVQQMIRKIVRERIQPLVNLDIDFVDDPRQANVRISFDPNGGAWSLVGTDHLNQKSGATMNLGWFDVATTIHEFGHMLGMIHEHQNPKGEKIKWNDSKVFEWAKSTQGWSEKTAEQNIINHYNIDTINGSSFDPESIMLYFFPASLTTNGVGTHQNMRLSGLDVMWIHSMYPSEHKITPQEFYQQIYGESIQSSIEKSRQEATLFNKGFDFNWKSIGIGFLIILMIIIIMSVIWWFISKLKHSTNKVGRYGSVI